MSNARDADELTYREQHVQQMIREHEQRITENERRWLVTKGALGMLALVKGVDFGIDFIISLI